MADLEIFLFILGDSPASKRMFSVIAHESTSVGTWRQSVYAQGPSTLNRCKAADLNLLKLNVPITVDEVDKVAIWPVDQDFSSIAEEMLPAEKLSYYFSVPPPRKSLHVIVVLPSFLRKRKLSSLSLSDESDPVEHYASTFGKPVVYARLEPKNYAFNRPPSTETIPLALLHKIFGRFVENARTRVPTVADNALVWELRQVMSVVYETEAKLCHEFRKTVEKHYGDIQFEAATIGSTAHQSDGHIRYQGFLYSVAEGKALGEGVGDPEVQACGYFITSLKQLYADNKGDFPDLFPCLIIYFTGPLVCFSGAVVTDRIHLETLTPTFSLHVNVHESEIALQAARAFSAFRLACADLRDYYANLAPRMPGPNRPEARRLLFPYEDHYTAGDGKRVEFGYLERLHTTKLIFTARNSKGDELFIKFTRRYSTDAHRYCSDKGIAPKLYAVEELPGGWMMVVMEFLGDNAYIPPRSSEVESAILRDGLKAAVDILHQGEFVHGDIRNANVMVKTKWDTSDVGNVKLVDFDWAGQVGRVEYPPNVNFKEIDRPVGARDGEKITKEHDLEMLGNIFSVTISAL